MDKVKRVRVILGISEDNTAEIELLEVLLEKAREDIEAFCRDTFIDDAGKDIFPKELVGVQEDLAIQRYRKRGAEGNASYSLADESVSFEDEFTPSQKRKMHAFVQLFPNRNRG